MKVFTVMFHAIRVDTIAAIFSTEEAAKKRAEQCAAKLFPNNEFYWNGHFLSCDSRVEEWSVQEWTVQE